MLLKLQVKNYKSLEDFELRVDNFNVLIGPNNSGKSNVFDCLSFLSEVSREGTIVNAIRRREEYEHIVYGGHSDREIQIGIEAEIDRSRVNYEFSFWKYDIIKEKLTVDKNGETTILFEGEGGRGKVFDELERVTREYSVGSQTLALYSFYDLKRSQTAVAIKNYFQNWKFYSFIPFMMRTYEQPRKNLDAGVRGEHLAQVLHTLLSEYPSHFEKIDETLRASVRETERLHSPLTEDGRTYVGVKEKYFKKPFTSMQISDGTLRLLAHLAVLFSPSSPPLACFEEPENHVHPRLLELLAEVLKKGAAKTQVLVSTHSPYFLNFIPPENLIIIERVEGKTISKRLKKGELKDFLEEFSIGELWYSGELGGTP
ncbi:MAG: AAA family ATPase [Euryarchaeota archaeon]|nr:AAA family ATPase [Euryarchaeota archaeon]